MLSEIKNVGLNSRMVFNLGVLYSRTFLYIECKDDVNIYLCGLCIGVPGEQCLGVTLVDVRDWRRHVHDEPLPLSPKSTLSWVG